MDMHPIMSDSLSGAVAESGKDFPAQHGVRIGCMRAGIGIDVNASDYERLVVVVDRHHPLILG